MLFLFYFFFFKQKTAYEMRISDWSSDVCSSDLRGPIIGLEHFTSGALEGAPAGFLTRLLADRAARGGGHLLDFGHQPQHLRPGAARVECRDLVEFRSGEARGIFLRDRSLDLGVAYLERGHEFLRQDRNEPVVPAFSIGKQIVHTGFGRRDRK